MLSSVLYDAVILRHFAAISRLDILEGCHGSRPEPRWVTAVRDEIEAGRIAGQRECRSILEWSWFGDPMESSADDLLPISRIQVALGNAGYETENPDDELRHRGEAESIHFAQLNGYYFVTDDNDAYRIARLRLGPDRVLDTFDLLCLTVANGEMTTREAVETHTRIRAAGRHLRSPYEKLLTSADFS